MCGGLLPRKEHQAGPAEAASHQAACLPACPPSLPRNPHLLTWWFLLLSSLQSSLEPFAPLPHLSCLPFLTLEVKFNSTSLTWRLTLESSSLGLKQVSLFTCRVAVKMLLKFSDFSAFLWLN